MKKIIQTIKQKWPEYILEIFVIMIGILGAYTLNNWNESRKERLQERAILVQLRTEFQSNLNQLDRKIGMKTEHMNSTIQLFHYIDHPNTRNKDSIDYHLVRTMPFSTFDPIVNDLASSGNLRLISNDSLKQKLSFWTSAIKDVREEEINWMDYRNNFYVPFLLKYYQLRTLRTKGSESNVLDKYSIEGKSIDVSIETGSVGRTKHPENFNLLLNHPDFEDHLERSYTIKQMGQSTIANLEKTNC